ncbi:MAG: nucleotidyltransferase family protein [Desulfobulbus sp.]
MSQYQSIQDNKQAIIDIARTHGLFNLRVFGSVARGEDTIQSDIDFLVDLETGRSLLDIGGALVQLEKLLGCKVDIVTEQGLHWYLREKILKEARLI